MADEKKDTEPSNYAGTVKVNIRGRDYYVHISAPMPMMSLDDLLKGLERNRAIIKASQEKMRDTFIMEAFEYAAPWLLNYDGPTQDAIQAHIHINMLVPLINLKGGNANFEKPETFPVKQRVELMRNVAEKSVFMDRMLHQNTMSTAITMTFMLVVVLGLVLL
ncbi:MAG: hypothetical protein QJT81_01585 [Candidatus Thiothrix putei]|uniref:Uncharacterized protein n=1 Tax=Candidatus Thiothrix putei TaxID=3080811 RepID=A0AA95KMY9_9GAMM|nr:MAG: hypothetical protein QJT81_01585 [Candidatus Thiothrix putei]